jgi:esterase/lipase superfamily enzyme
VFLPHACMALHACSCFSCSCMYGTASFFFRFPSNKTQVISISRVTRCNTQE